MSALQRYRLRQEGFAPGDADEIAAFETEDEPGLSSEPYGPEEPPKTEAQKRWAQLQDPGGPSALTSDPSNAEIHRAVGPEAFALNYSPPTANQKAPADAPAAKAFDYESILSERALPADMNDAALRNAQRNDRANYWFARAADAAPSIATGAPIQYGRAPPSEAAALLERRKSAQGRDDKSRELRLRLAQLMRPPKPEDPSLVQRRKDLASEAQDRAALAREQLDERRLERAQRGEFGRSEGSRKAEADKATQEYRRQLLEIRRREAAAKAARGAGRGPGAGKELPTGSLSELADYEVAEKAIDDLAGAFNALKMGGAEGKLGSAATKGLGLQGTDSAQYNADAKQAMQFVGKILEGGKLAAGDEVKYEAMLPKAGDSDAVVAAKVNGLKAKLRQQRAAKLKAYGSGGYKTPETDEPDATAGRVTVSNGTETLEIDAADLPAAEADGFKRVK